MPIHRLLLTTLLNMLAGAVTGCPVLYPVFRHYIGTTDSTCWIAPHHAASLTARLYFVRLPTYIKSDKEGLITSEILLSIEASELNEFASRLTV